MPDPLSSDLLFTALLIVALFLIILSTPTIILSVRASSKLLTRYRILRSVEEMDETGVTKHMIEEWNSVKSPLSYTAILSDEIERLSSLRQATLHSQIAVVLLIIMAFYPGYETDVLIAVAVTVAVVLFVIIYGMVNLRRYIREYVNALAEMDVNGDEAVSRIYG